MTKPSRGQMAQDKKQSAAEDTTALAERASVAVQVVPDYMAEAVLERGDIDMRGAALPLIKLVQANSPEAIEGRIKPGTFLVTSGVDSTALGVPLFVVPVVQKRKRIKWVPMDEGGGIECLASDGDRGSLYGACDKCPHKDFGKTTAPACTFYYDYLSLVFTADEVRGVAEGGVVEVPGSVDVSKKRGPAVLSCYMTKLKAARKFNTDIMRLGLKMYAGLYSITPELEKKGPYTYWVFRRVVFVGFVPRELFEYVHVSMAPMLAGMSPEEYTAEKPAQAAEGGASGGGEGGGQDF